MSRFAAVSAQDLAKLVEDKDSKSTQRTIKRSVSLFREFLEQTDNNFEGFDKQKLNDKLRLFYASVRNKNGVNLKTSTLQSIKYGLSKYLKEKCQVDIHNDVEFRTSQDVYKAVITDLKKKGYGGVQHKEVISDDDMKALYSNNMVFNVNTPCGLQKKVWFEIMYFLCRRGRENLREMTKSTFAIGTDSKGLGFVYQSKDEADKNHRLDTRPDDTVGEARMYEQPGNPMCPVQSYKKYLLKLHPDLDDLWQRPLESYEETSSVWYYKAPLGKNTLGTFMAEISKQGTLSRTYTNHSVRATSITALDNAGVEARHIMRASGHKSESSIRSYACRLSETKKREMSDCLSVNLGKNSVSKQSVGKENMCIDSNVSTSSEINSLCNSSVLPDITEQELNDIFNSDVNMFEPLETSAQQHPVNDIKLDTGITGFNPLSALHVFRNAKFDNCTFNFNINNLSQK